MSRKVINSSYQVVPPTGYNIEREGFRQWRATAPDGTDLGVHEMQRYAANRCHRHYGGHNW